MNGMSQDGTTSSKGEENNQMHIYLSRIYLEQL